MAMLESTGEYYCYFLERFAEAKISPCDDLLSTIATATLPDGDHLTDAEMLGMLSPILVADPRRRARDHDEPREHDHAEARALRLEGLQPAHVPVRSMAAIWQGGRSRSGDCRKSGSNCNAGPTTFRGPITFRPRLPMHRQ